MSENYSKDYRRHNSREDPRLARRDRESKSVEAPKQLYDKLGVPISPKHKLGNDSPRKDPRTRESSASGWQGHQQNSGYNQTMQTAYQHLPPSVYNDPNQYSTQGYSAYPSYQQNYGATAAYNHYQGYGQATAYMSGTVQPGPPGEEYPQGGWAPVGGYISSQPQTQVVNQVPVPTAETKTDENRKEAVAQEMKQQKAQLIKQREEYVRKATVLRRELDLLRNQKQELLSEHSIERDNEHILRENNKLQDEIQSKMKAIYNVIEMLSSIIRDNRKISELEEQLKDESPKHHRKDKDQNRSTHKSPPTENFVTGGKYNYVHYDPELHWCRICDVFPKTAKDLLLHLQTKEHRETAQERDVGDSSPWHNLPAEPELPHYEGAPKKRLPIKGLQFFISAPAWYCKLCDTWIGDLHCASQHLKSQVHSQNYANFVEQNPHWEIEWLKDREKAHARVVKHENSDSEDNEKKKKKHKHSPSSSKEKKRKKKSKKRKKHSSDSSSSSSSSDSSSEEEKGDKSKSIRVAMRNMKVQAIMNEDIGSKWDMLGRLVEEHKRKENTEMARKESNEKESGPEDNLISQWMTVVEPPDKDKQLLDSLKDRMKQKQEVEKAKIAELERKQKEKEREEQELKEKKEREEREASEREEQKRREREREEYERIRDRDREQVKFKPREKHNKRDSPDHKRKPSRSPSVEQKRSRQQTPDRHKQSRHSENGRHTSDDRDRGRSNYDKSPDNRYRHDDKDSHENDKKSRKSSSSSNKRLPFIGRMPLFKNKKFEEKVEREIKKEDYDIPRQSRFQPGNLARAFIPEPDVVCFPKLSCIPPLTIPPPPPVQPVMAPAAPKISEGKPPKTPPPPKIGTDSKKNEKKTVEEKEEKNEKQQNENENIMQDYQMMYDPAMMAQYQYDYNNMMYSMYDYGQDMMPPPDSIVQQQDEQVPLEHTMPLQPPPLPPDDPNDDLALLGISADDMAVQMF